MTPELETELNEAFEHSFMQPVIYLMDYFEVDTSNGTEYVPGDLITLFMETNTIVTDNDPEFATLAKALRDFIGDPVIYTIEAKHGYLARLSASGYMDCTDWSAFETDDEAARYLIDTYGDEE